MPAGLGLLRTGPTSKASVNLDAAIDRAANVHLQFHGVDCGVFYYASGVFCVCVPAGSLEVARIA